MFSRMTLANLEKFRFEWNFLHIILIYIILQLNAKSVCVFLSRFKMHSLSPRLHCLGHNPLILPRSATGLHLWTRYNNNGVFQVIPFRTTEKREILRLTENVKILRLTENAARFP